MSVIENSELFKNIPVQFQELFAGCDYPWQVLPHLSQYLADAKLDQKTNRVQIGQGTVVEPGVVIFGPTIIGDNCRIRSGAYLRGNIIIGNNVTVGHAVELKNCLIMDEAHIGHFNYVGDSILGHKTHMAGGAILANNKLSGGEIIVRDGEHNYPTGLEKFGAVIGDNAEIGANAVLNPGSIIGRNSIVYPLVSWRGVLPANKIAKNSTLIVDRT